MRINWGVLIPVVLIIAGASFLGGTRAAGMTAVGFGVLLFIANMIPTGGKR